MRAMFSKTVVTFIREDDDPKFYGVKAGAGESRLFYYIKEFLNAHGFNVIKKRMWKDGHLVDDCQQYIRTRKRGTGTPDIYIHNNRWAIEGAEVDWNNGAVTLALSTDVFESGQPTVALIQRLCEGDLRLGWVG